ncbi:MULTISPECIES: ABC transporter permease [Providencia]|uniref:ABC transporter, permease protein n=1 Tax=Providencia rustigianii DSM 4541 TaxID=500637 RepID=D1P4B4_9GAMM|nr:MULTISPECIES: iron ABC transporter permease [Providencia]EFB71740.1 ABC transporter, permease protein [Providencia rustigianii DSM 4541]MTC55441.1 ABC transporter permease subunit [Providencia rustigianii]SUC28067.1 Sulfate transport system permease protein CysW [Providencia rustigianii]
MDSINKTGLSNQRGAFGLPRFGFSPLSICVVVITLGVMTPLLFLLWLAASSGVSHWEHLLKYVLPDATFNTLMLLLGVGVLVMVIGAGCAWLVTAFDFPGKRLFSWALLLPLAMPTYIVAFAWLDLLHPIGPIQEVIRNLLGYSGPREFRLPDLRSMTGAILLLGLVLYPYVYLTMRAMFMSQPAHLLEAARTLGLSSTGTFFRVALPMARPALVVGTSLALLETLNDIGASEFLGINTLTVTVYTTWVTRSDLAAAAQIACSMLTVIILLLALEYYGRKNQRYSTGRQMRGILPTRLTGVHAWLATLCTLLPVLLGFVAPALFLGWESIKRLSDSMEISTSLLQSLQNSLLLAMGVTVVVTLVSLIVAWYARSSAISGGSPETRRTLMKVASLGYAVPGTVLAIGLLTPGMALDNVLAELFNYRGLPLLSSGILLVICCSIRFMAISIGAIDAGLTRIPPSMEQASRLLGESESRTFFRVHLPLLRPALVTSALLVFADAMKELPTTLLLRPVNFETLATSLYAEAARGTYEEGAIAALLIVLAGTLPVILLARSQLSSSKSKQQ